jgi:hypothetical protein
MPLNDVQKWPIARTFGLFMNTLKRVIKPNVEVKLLLVIRVRVALAFSFVSNSISLCTIMIADDKVLGEPVVAVWLRYSYRRLGILCHVTTLKHYGIVCGIYIVGGKV